VHQLLIGRTRSGKSSLAKELCSELRIAGHEVLAFNPLAERGWTRRDEYGRAGAEWESDDALEFLVEVQVRILEKPKVRFLAIDEGHELFTRGDCDAKWLATKGRHYGLNLIIVTQRGADMNVTARAQCLPVYVFQCSLTDAALLADEFGKPELKEAPTLRKGEFFRVDEDGIERRKLF
jgi:DNA helicase HerA-like ATPase